MNLKKMSALALLGLLSMGSVSYANEVFFNSDGKPLNIEYRIAHQNKLQAPVFGETKSVTVENSVTIPVALDQYDFAGVVIVAVNGHQLPDNINQFNQPEQCSMTTNQDKVSGALRFKMDAKSLSCATYGGVFG